MRLLRAIHVAWSCTMVGLLASCDPDSACGRNFRSSGFFRVEESCGRWWFVTPEGKRFYSTGVNHISFQGDTSPVSKSNPYAETVTAKYGNEEAWAEATAKRLKEWGWNSVGAWSSYGTLGKHMPYTIILDLSQANWLSGKVPDYFSAEWEAEVEKRAESLIRGHETDSNLIGYFIDNEMHWGPDWRSGKALFDEYLEMAEGSAGRKAAGVAPDGSTFLESLAHRFFSVTTGAIRKRDPNHLVLGVRFVSALVPREVAAVSAEYLDVVSVNAYEFVAPPERIFNAGSFGFVNVDTPHWLQGFHDLTGKPVLITEFGFRAADSGLPNTWPPIYPTLLTQAERADRFEAYARRCFEAPYIVGYHWFEYADQPSAGRFDGENNNWGLVNVQDEPYATLTERTARVNREPEDWP